MKALKIPEATVSRLSVYSRFLFQIDKKGIITISSGDIAQGVGVSPAQVRKDLAYFGEFGTRGVGYNVKDLHNNILKILGLNKRWKVVLVGAGNLGSALCIYGGFKERGFDIVGIFDNNPKKVGFKVNDLEIMPMDALPEVIKENQVKIGIITVPSEYAQDVANLLIENNVTTLLNFAPKVLSVPRGVIVRTVDLSVNLEILTFNITNQKR
ncbi:redox-sensing transcriptional repressor Rex [Desulfitibacter alkalitolerans]|uniref:redox-sensing transcriptional repressor Rex n=1 Tax=Desulfitibacter alkalitolerans TaxID=264641 RepID=UPI00048374D7|nr:redox-sensing transcriptional repressor Rex [Desulfitibacter alkalitolerans]